MRLSSCGTGRLEPAHQECQGQLGGRDVPAAHAIAQGHYRWRRLLATGTRDRIGASNGALEAVVTSPWKESVNHATVLQETKEIGMRGSESGMLKLAAFGLSVLSVCAPASATIFDIAASDSVGTEVAFTPGSYLIKWVGIADGGIYDAANVSFCSPSCTTGFTNAFVALDADLGSLAYEIGIITTRTLYASAADSLAAYKSGNNIYSDFAHFVN